MSLRILRLYSATIPHQNHPGNFCGSGRNVAMNLGILSQTSEAAAASLDPSALPPAFVEGLYIHIPFCFHKCHYCDFYSITRQTPERMARFVDLVLQEARAWTTHPPQIGPQTIFFGGGTPSLLPLPDMQRLIAGLREIFDLSAVNEWTIECNPATVSGDYLSMLRESGVDRLSFGAQSFDPSELATLDRHHAPSDVNHSIALARSSGFDRLTVDLIC